MLLTHLQARALRDPAAFIQAAEAQYDRTMGNLAGAIKAGASECPFLLLSGPSGSGKTTTAGVLAARLDAMGLETHTISLDNYFRTFTPEEKELFRQNRLDLESPERMDGDLLSDHLAALMRGEAVHLPHYDFTTNVQAPGDTVLKLHPGQLIIFEGIHALNPAVVQSAEAYTRGLYISVRTRIEYDGGKLLHPAKLRLARRMIRDCRERGRTYADVVAQYQSVERGEALYIMPYKHRADFELDTFVPYELCVYRSLLPDNLPDASDNPHLAELLGVLARLPAIPPAAVPDNALIREFIGQAR